MAHSGKRTFLKNERFRKTSVPDLKNWFRRELRTKKSENEF